MTELIYNKSLREISQEIYNILDPILNKEDLEKVLTKLIGYRFVDEIYKIQRGKFIRWISNSATKPHLTNGGIVIDIKFLDSGTHILCKNNIGKIIQIKFDGAIIFQKLSNDENLILFANDFIQSK